MKYYFVKDVQNHRHIVVAKDDIELNKVLENAKVYALDAYELKEDTFENAGFLISDKNI